MQILRFFAKIEIYKMTVWIDKRKIIILPWIFSSFSPTPVIYKGSLIPDKVQNLVRIQMLN